MFTFKHFSLLIFHCLTYSGSGWKYVLSTPTSTQTPLSLEIPPVHGRKKGCFCHSAHYLGRDFSTKLIKKGAKWFNNDSAHWRRGHNLIKKGCRIIIPRHHEAPLHCCSLCAHSFLNDTCPHCYKKKHGACILHGPFVNHEIFSISLKF